MSPNGQLHHINDQALILLFLHSASSCWTQSSQCLSLLILGSLLSLLLDLASHEIHNKVDIVLKTVLQFLVVTTTLVRSPLLQGFRESIENGGTTTRNLILEVFLVVFQEVKVDFVFLEDPAASGDATHVHRQTYHLVLIEVGLVGLLRPLVMVLDNSPALTFWFSGRRNASFSKLRLSFEILLPLKHKLNYY